MKLLIWMLSTFVCLMMDERWGQQVQEILKWKLDPKGNDKGIKYFSLCFSISYFFYLLLRNNDNLCDILDFMCVLNT